TLDDQAETVLMRLVRGAGTRGLAGIYPRLAAGGSRPAARKETHPSSIIRPLLGVRRRELEEYLRFIGQDWREDSSNRDLRFARNRVRHGILPRLERGLNPAVRECLAEAADLARAEEDYWERLVEATLPAVSAPPGGQDRGAALFIPTLVELPLALRRRVVRAALRNPTVALEFQHVEEILEVAAGSAKAAALPQGWSAVRVGDRLEMKAGRQPEAVDYEFTLPVPGRVTLPAVGITLEAILLPQPAGYNPEHCLELSLLTTELKVRNWRAGDRYWPPHTKAPKKVKELLQEHHVTGSAKKLWPVVESGDEIVWVRGFAVPSRFGARKGEAVLIREEPWDTRSGARTTKK
ncbi:MAG TPA: tRNA lysidine(34) synthetase TilS, partial [Terriglobales bacterium]|nr:tRNA lysidine(34) synthetase TilS [Terriglobales bacterium]